MPRIIAMTAGVSPDEIEDCWRVGMADFLGKPFEWPEPAEKLRSHAGKSHPSL